MSNHTCEKQGEGNNFKLTFSTLGCVKWFNNRSGYGFIVAIGDQSHYGDVFVHHSQLRISDPNIYKTLVPGEYVQFEITPTPNGKHKYQANNVTGVYGGKLLCENSPVNRPSVPPSSQLVESRNKQEMASQPKYRILQRPSSSSTNIHTASAGAVPNQPNEPQQQHASPPPPEAPATGFALPKSKKPRNPKSIPSLAASTPRVVSETPYKNATKRPPSKEA
jgi:cold shock CspA family protein